MNIKNKSPMFAGLINVLIPGASQLYINKDWGRFIRAFVVNILVLAAAITLGSLFQQSRSYKLPPGLCMGVLIMAYIAVLFGGGYQTARLRNNETNAANFYNSKRRVSHESEEVQHADIQKMRDEGLISEQEFDEKNSIVDQDKEPH